jgi:hypothetical protein
MYAKERLEIAACPDNSAFFHNTDEIVALNVVVMKITIHFFSAGQTGCPVCEDTAIRTMWLYQSAAVNGRLDDIRR